MVEQLTEKVGVEVERVGFLNDGGIDNSYPSLGIDPFVQHENFSLTFRNRDIAIAAKKAGYQTGDTFKYKIVIEPKL